MRFFTLFSLSIFFATGLAAASPSVEDIQTLVERQAFNELDDVLDQADIAFSQGQFSAKDLRALYFVLSRSHPKTVQFVKDWLAEDPQNPKAQVSRGWSLFNRARAMADAGNDRSVQTASDMYAEARQLFSSAYRTAPYLLPASDAVVRGITKGNPEISDPYRALHRILNTHPNWGSAARYLMTNRFRFQAEANQECLKIAEKFDSADGLRMNHRCIISIASRQSFPRFDAYVEQHLIHDTDAETTLDRFDFFLTRIPPSEWSVEQAEWAINVVLHHPFSPHQLAILDARVHHMALMLQSQDHLPAIDLRTTFRKTRLDEAMALLERDPYNFALIDMVEETAFAPETTYERVGPGEFKTTVIYPDLTPEEEAALKHDKLTHELRMARYRLGASPFQSDSWMDYALKARRANQPYSMFDGYAAAYNAVAYAWDPARYLQYIIGDHREDYYTVRAIQKIDMSTVLDVYVPEFTVRKTWADNVDINEQIICPYTRALRVYKAMCRDYPEGAMQCDMSMISTESNTAELDRKSQTEPACAAIRAAPINDLWFPITPF